MSLGATPRESENSRDLAEFPGLPRTSPANSQKKFSDCVFKNKSNNGPGDTPCGTLPQTPPFSGTLSGTLAGTLRARRAPETPVAGRGARKSRGSPEVQPNFPRTSPSLSEATGPLERSIHLSRKHATLS